MNCIVIYFKWMKYTGLARGSLFCFTTEWIICGFCAFAVSSEQIERNGTFNLSCWFKAFAGSWLINITKIQTFELILLQNFLHGLKHQIDTKLKGLLNFVAAMQIKHSIRFTSIISDYRVTPLIWQTSQGQWQRDLFGVCQCSLRICLKKIEALLYYLFIS